MPLDQGTTSFATPLDRGGILYLLPDTAVVDNVYIFLINGLKYRRIVDGVFRASWVVTGATDQTANLQAVLNTSGINEVVFDNGDVNISGNLNANNKILTFKSNGRLVGGTVSNALLNLRINPSAVTSSKVSCTEYFYPSGNIHTSKSVVGPATFWNIAYDNIGSQALNQILSVGHTSDNTLRNITINTVLHINQSNFTGTGQWVQCGLISDSNYRPSNSIFFKGVNRILGNRFESQVGVAFTDSAVYSNMELRIDSTGQIFVWIDSISSTASLSATPILIVPIHITYFITPLT